MIESLLAAIIGFSISTLGLHEVDRTEITEQELLVKIAGEIESSIQLGPRSEYCACKESNKISARVSNETISVSLDKSTSEESYNREIKKKVEAGIRKHLADIKRIYGDTINFTIPITIQDDGIIW